MQICHPGFRARSGSPIYFRASVLATARELIDAAAGQLTMRVHDQVEVFNAYKALKLPAHYEELP